MLDCPAQKCSVLFRVKTSPLILNRPQNTEAHKLRLLSLLHNTLELDSSGWKDALCHTVTKRSRFFSYCCPSILQGTARLLGLMGLPAPLSSRFQTTRGEKERKSRKSHFQLRRETGIARITPAPISQVIISFMS